jgi:hypothetical protein
MTALSSSAIRRWSEAELFRSVDLGLSIEDANRQAEKCWAEILSGRSASRVLADVADLPDVLHALCRLLQDSTEAASREVLAATAALFEFSSEDMQSLADADEKHVLSAAFAYVAWRSCRRLALWPEARSWESRCEQHVISQDDAGEFLRLRTSDRVRTSPRFLNDRATLLAAYRQLRRKANEDPAEALQFAIAAYRWVASGLETVDDEERSYFAGELALAAASALRLAGRWIECGSWIQLSANWLSRTANPLPSLARVEQAVAASLYNRLEPAESLPRLPRLLQIFEAFRMEEELNKCRFLQSLAFKDLGRVEEAVAGLQTLTRSVSVQNDPLLFGLALAHLGEAQALRGMTTDALRSFSSAVVELGKAKIPWATAECKAMMAGAVRDLGEVEGAIPLYRSAVEVNLAMGLDGRAAYLRVFHAEALLMGGHEAQAADEILEALPILNREALAPAATAALGLLLESLRRQKTDPDALRRLRVELQRMNEQTQS